VSVCRYSCRILRIAATSAEGRFQFAEDSVKSVSVWIPSCGAHRMVFLAASAPALWPYERGSPREVAQRPFPSQMMATWRGCVAAVGASGKRCRTIDCISILNLRRYMKQCTLHYKVHVQKNLPVARRSDQRLHMIQVTFQRFPSSP